MKLEKSSRGVEMSEAAVAQSLLFDIAVSAKPRGENGKSSIGLIFSMLLKRYPTSKWTHRRVRGLWNDEVPDWRIRARELRELSETLHALEEARKQHADFKAETDKIRAQFLGLATTLAHGDEDFHRPSIEGLRDVVLGVAGPGTEGGEP